MLSEFAATLRTLREEAGSPKFVTMSRRVGRSKSTLAEAVGGRHLPRWDTVVDFVRACDGDPAEWRARWERVRAELTEAAARTPPGGPRRPNRECAEPERAVESEGVESAGLVESEVVVETDDPAGSAPAPARVTACDSGLSPSPVATPLLRPEPDPRAIDPPIAAVPRHAVPVPARSEVSRADEPAPPGVLSVRLAPLVAVIVLCAFSGIAGYVLGQSGGRPASGPAVRAVEVQNKVALGPDRLVEDRTPAYLSTIPMSSCALADRRCTVPGTGMHSGAGLVAHCTVRGQELHNYDLADVAARSNPDRSDSDLWYRVAFPDGRVGYISEVNLTSTSRGGLGLPRCGPGAATTRAGGPQG